MANLAGVVQQLRKERDQAVRTVQQLDAALAALNGVHLRREPELEAACRWRRGRGSPPRRGHDGLRRERMEDRSETSYRCVRKKRCRLPLAERLPPLKKRDGRG